MQFVFGYWASPRVDANALRDSSVRFDAVIASINLAYRGRKNSSIEERVFNRSRSGPCYSRAISFSSNSAEIQRERIQQIPEMSGVGRTFTAGGANTSTDSNKQYSRSLSVSNLDYGELCLSVSGLSSDQDIILRISEDALEVCRHRLGRLLFYWAEIAGVIVFSTEFSRIAELVDREKISNQALLAFTSFSYFPAPLTPLEEVYQIEAGSTTMFSDTGRFKKDVHSYQESEFLVDDDDEAEAQLEALLNDAISHTFKDKSETVGVFLSGGLDSSYTAAALHGAGCKIRCYSLDFGDYGNPEFSFAQEVCDYLKVPLTKVDARPRHISKAIEQNFSSLGIPFGDGVTVPLSLLSRAAAQEVSTVFNGEGGDQLFAGWTNKPIIASSIYSKLGNGDNEIGKNSTEEERFVADYLKTFHRLNGYESRTFSDELLTNLFSESTSKEMLIPFIEEAIRPSDTRSLMHRLRRANLMLKGAQNIQPRASAIAAGYGLNLRSLFCYDPLVDWTFSLSPQMFLRGAHEKYIFKIVAEKCLPKALVWREKRGMGVPLTQWILGPLWKETWRYLNPAVLKAEGRFREDLPFNIANGRLGGLITGRRIGEIMWLILSWQAFRASVLKHDLPSRLYNPFWLWRNPFEE